LSNFFHFLYQDINNQTIARSFLLMKYFGRSQ